MDRLSFDAACDIVANQLTVARLTLQGESFLDALEEKLEPVEFEAAMDHLRGAVTELEQLHNILKVQSGKQGTVRG